MSVASAAPGTLEFQVQFIHPEKMLALPVDPAMIENAVSPVFHGAEPASVADVRARFRDSVVAAADVLLGESDFLADLERLPLGAGQTLAAFGDSLTDDLQSWAYILDEVLRRRGGARVVNLGRSGDTTTHLLERLPALLALEPDAVVVLVGTNDGKAFTFAPDRSLVAPSESHRNARALDAALRHAEIPAAWVLPPLAEEAVAAECEFWTAAAMMWSNDHLRATRTAIASAVSAAADLNEAFAGHPELLLRDGLHPNRDGQLVITRAIVHAVAEGKA